MVTALMSSNVFIRTEKQKNSEVTSLNKKYTSQDQGYLSQADAEDTTKIEYQSSAIDSNSVFVSDDGLTYQEVYEMLMSMLNDNTILLSEVIALAKVMVREGVRIAKESQLTKRKMKKLIISLNNKNSVQNTIQNKKSVLGR